ncbi:uncharacterized protein WM277_006484 [Molossus nigricans]
MKDAVKNDTVSPKSSSLLFGVKRHSRPPPLTRVNRQDAASCLSQGSFHGLSICNCLKYQVHQFTSAGRTAYSMQRLDVLIPAEISSLNFCFWKCGSLMFREILPSRTHLTTLYKIFFKRITD